MTDAITRNPRPPAIPDDWLAVFRQLRPALLGHIVDDIFVDEKIRSLVAGGHVVGTAATLRLPDGDLEALVPAVDRLEPGDVLVIDHGGRDSLACWGELTSLAAARRGCVGVIVDGAVANIREIAQHGLPTFARGVAALGGRRLGGGGAINVPIQCGGISVHPGDLVVADDDGVVVVPPERLSDIAAAGQAALRRLPLARAWIERGGLLGEITDLDAEALAARLREAGAG